ncbi:MAG TPA: bile acid:sodium symporter [Isosphaeraceae bacterium]|jgi:BASS family bile acid:Na+ symporter|nr:bile acid:sodium symporter [Isosphaeraceae bacterium]
MARIVHLLHKHLLWFLLGTYALAAVLPGLGLRIRGVAFGRVTLFGESMTVSLPTLMLAFLLLNAGLGVKVAELRNLARSPRALLLGLGANLLIPIAFIGAINTFLRYWHNVDEVQNILVGLALVASMPIAGSSTAWSQNSNGNLALSLALVFGSTLVSPFTTPICLHAIGFLAQGDYAEDLHELAAHSAEVFLAVCVILPSALGIAVHALAGERRVARARPALKLANTLNLLVLSYSNAAVSLPEAVRHPDVDFLALILLLTAALCLLAFGTGWGIARALGLGEAERTSLMFGLGMNNNGTGLVLASIALADHPSVMLPIILYNLVQQVVAGFVHDRANRPNAAVEPPSPAPALAEAS